MKQAQITLGYGRTLPVHIPDLNLVVRLGETHLIDEARARDSLCMTTLMQTGQVRVAYKRSDETKMANIPTKQSVHSVIQSRPLSQAPVQKVTPPPQAPPVDVDKLAAAVAIAVASQQTVQPAALEAMIERAVESALSRARLMTPGNANSGSNSNEDDPLYAEPVYIPTNIVGDAPVEIKTTAGISDAASLHDAAKALKSVNRPKRVKKQDHGEE